MESLRYYIAHNGGLNVLENRSGSMNTVGQFFEGKTLEHLIGCKNKPEVVFAAVAFDGGYRSEDAGKSWTKIMDGDVRTFTVDPHDERVVYMGIGPIRLFRSEDTGKTWEPLDGMLAIPDEAKKKWDVPPRLRGVEFPHVRHIFIHPDDHNLIYVLLEHGGVLLTRDRGKTWYDRSIGISYVDMHYIENYPGSKERYYVSSARGFYRSDNAGEHWRRVESGMPWGKARREYGAGKKFILMAVFCSVMMAVKTGASRRKDWETKTPGCPGCCCTIRPIRTRFSAAWATARAVTVLKPVSKAKARFTQAATAVNLGSR